MNLPCSEKTAKDLKKRKRLGLGVHLNVTLGGPLSRPSEIPSLLKPEKRFRRPPDYLEKMPLAKEIEKEYEAQIQSFLKHFGRKPDHFDTHHHLHDHPVFFAALREAALRWKVPVRRSRIFHLEKFSKRIKDLKTTDFIFGNLEARSHWQEDSFLGVVENLPEGTSEIGCHPGHCDASLRQTSSMQDVREEELTLFAQVKFRKLFRDIGIELIRFSDL